MALTKKCTRILDLIKSVRSAGAMTPGDKVQMPHEQPATYIGPVMEDEIQMHEFRLFDGTEVVLEVTALAVALVTAPQTMSVDAAACVGV